MGEAKCGINEYARSRGLKPSTLKDILKPDRRVREGIVYGYDAGEKLIYPEILDKEWFLRYRVEQEAKGKVFVPVASGVEQVPAVVVKDGHGQLPADGWVKVEGDEWKEVPSGSSDDYGFRPGVKPDYPEANRVWMVNKARREKMEADELEGLLVRKDAINRQLTVAGMEVRKELERLPVRLVDQVMAAKNRNDAVMVIEDTVAELLGRMGGIIENALKNEK